MPSCTVAAAATQQSATAAAKHDSQSKGPAGATKPEPPKSSLPAAPGSAGKVEQNSKNPGNNVTPEKK
jgi:hypothetical protein